MNKHKILEWFDDNYLNIIDTKDLYYEDYIKGTKSYPVLLHPKIKEQSISLFLTEISQNCGDILALPSAECYTELQEELLKLWK